jgi:hypothetical protein
MADDIVINSDVLDWLRCKVLPDDTPSPLPADCIRETELDIGLDNAYTMATSYGGDHGPECEMRLQAYYECTCGVGDGPSFTSWLDAHKRAIIKE